MRSRAHLFLIILLLASCSPIRSEGQVTVIAHPDGPLYAGDKVSFEVLSPPGNADNRASVSVTFDGKELGQADFGPYGIGGRRQATLWWIWDTRGLAAGRYTLTFTLLPGNISESKTYTLRPADQVPSPEPGAEWASTTTVCCILHYITGTAAARDISVLSQEADEQSTLVASQLGTQLNQRIDLVFMSRVIGNGGFTLGGVYVSYLDDNYIGNDMPILFHHEFVHFYDGALGGSYLPSIFQEGLAVYLSGGHFKPEPLLPRAAAMLELGWYIPLTTLADDFYNQQHEIGYLEAGASIGYLVGKYGWGAFNEFYRSIPKPADGESITNAIDSALSEHFNISFAEFETGFQSTLRAQPFTQEEKTDLEDTVDFFNTARRYQEALDPSAYFLTAWLPNGMDMIKHSIVADFLRRPEKWDNRLVETLLIRAHTELFSGDYKDTESTLRWTNWMLDVIAP